MHYHTGAWERDNYERYGLQAITVTVCRMDAAFERTGMCLQRVSAIACNSCLG